ncbi:unnamed protein product [Schistosoma mattheei]|uniref:Uncharacterized protein n=1 Tax=Schistosoma mattheei TaxID=31246 RepID=A0AA85BTP2_9TREM|nr:unnamed protein product [Schistosoma mattheei]CAH8545321.1 unnamed protein product [Schistosoma mattheei]
MLQLSLPCVSCLTVQSNIHSINIVNICDASILRTTFRPHIIFIIQLNIKLHDMLFTRNSCIDYFRLPHHQQHYVQCVLLQRQNNVIRMCPPSSKSIIHNNHASRVCDKHTRI